ncbi:MAG: hypothetical protein ACYCZ7_00935 [Minisyncoccota bacterium]
MALKYITDYDEIRGWIEERRGVPATLKETNENGEESTDMLHIAFGTLSPDMEEMSWDEFFERFENENLALEYDDEAEGGETPSFEFVDRDRARDELAPETELPDSGDMDMLLENTIPDSDPHL